MKTRLLLAFLLSIVAGLQSMRAQEAYACYTSGNTTLTFYYDNLRSSRSGTTYDLNADYLPDWYTDGTKTNVTKAVFDTSFANARPTSTYGWFAEMANLQSIEGMEYLNTSEVTTMYGMFYYCPSLTSLNLSHFNTSKVTSMYAMFYSCESLTILDVSSFNTFKVTNMYLMFIYCFSLKTIYVGSGWSTAAVTSSDYMFYDCTRLIGGQGTTYDENHVDASYANVDGGTSNPGYFTDKNTPYACYTSENTTLTFYCDNLRSSRTGVTYDLNYGNDAPAWYDDGIKASVTKVVFDASFAEARPTSTIGWFFQMENLQSIEGMEYLNTSEVTNMTNMFHGCESLTNLDVSHFNTGKVTRMWGMFQWCRALTSLDLSSFNTSKVTNMSHMFYACQLLKTIYVGNGWSTAAVTDSEKMFYLCTSIVGGAGTKYIGVRVDARYAHIDGGTSNPGYFTGKNALCAYACYTSENTTLTFYYDNLRDSRSGTTYSLNSGTDYPGWKFDGTNANVTKVVFDTSFANARPTSTYDWFGVMENLQSIEGMEYLNTSEVTNMGEMFNGCASLASLDLSSFNTRKVNVMSRMFYACTSLTSLDVSSFNTSNVTNMAEMFYGCIGLTGLDLSSFNTSKVGNMHQMFYYCMALKTIYVGNGWSIAYVTDSEWMFLECTSIVGGAGTVYTGVRVDASYAHIDGGGNNPGYLTDVNSVVLDLWIADIQVTGANKNDLTELVAEMDEEAMERYYGGVMEITFNFGSNTLTLKDAIIRPETGAFGIMSRMQNLNIKLIGENTIAATDALSVNLQRNSGKGVTTFIGNGSLDITSNSNSGAFSTVRDIVIKDGAKITVEGTGDLGFQGSPVMSGGNGPKLTLQGAETVLRAKGGSSGSLVGFSALYMGNTIKIIEPVGAAFIANRGVVMNGSIVANEWVMIADQDYIDGVEDVNVDLNLNDSWYDLQGRKVMNPRKGIYIKNGKKVLVK